MDGVSASGTRLGRWATCNLLSACAAQIRLVNAASAGHLWRKLHRTRGRQGKECGLLSPPTWRVSAASSGLQLDTLSGAPQPKQYQDNYLPEPGALKDSEGGSEKFQHNVVPKNHLHEDAESPSEHGTQQEGVNVLVQGRPVVDMVVEEKTCHEAGYSCQRCLFLR